MWGNCESVQVALKCSRTLDNERESVLSCRDSFERESSHTVHTRTTRNLNGISRIVLRRPT